MTSDISAITLQERTANFCAEQRFAEAAELLAEALSRGESAELWNDWGATQLALQQPMDAERAFRRALALDSTHTIAASNLGVLLFCQHRYEQAIPALRQALVCETSPDRAQLTALLAECEAHACQNEQEASLSTVSSVDITKDASASALPPVPQAAPEQSYDDWFASVFRQRITAPNVRIATSWNEDSHWGQKSHNAL